MEQKELLQYIKDAIDQETDIIQQENIIDEYNTLSNEQKPTLRKKSQPQPPQRKSLDSSAFIIAVAMFFLFGVLSSLFLGLGYSTLSDANQTILEAQKTLSEPRRTGIGNDSHTNAELDIEQAIREIEENKPFISLGWICFPFFGFSALYIIAKVYNRQNTFRKATNEHNLTCQQIAQYNLECKTTYERDLKLWKQTSAEMNAFMQKPLEESKKLLQRYYSSNTIYPKYCNLPALTSIYEYFITGRCSELTGPHGAYNLYEDELRKDTVISQLNTVIENLEQIRQNQYMLYQQVKAIQENTSVIVSEIKQIKGYTIQIAQLTALNAYYSALNERNTRITMYHHL